MLAKIKVKGSQTTNRLQKIQKRRYKVPLSFKNTVSEIIWLRLFSNDQLFSERDQELSEIKIELSILSFVLYCIPLFELVPHFRTITAKNYKGPPFLMHGM